MKRVKVRGHFRHVVVGAKVAVDPDNPANETYVYIMKKIWVEPYTKMVK